MGHSFVFNIHFKLYSISYLSYFIHHFPADQHFFSVGILQIMLWWNSLLIYIQESFWDRHLEMELLSQLIDIHINITSCAYLHCVGKWLSSLAYECYLAYNLHFLGNVKKGRNIQKWRGRESILKLPTEIWDVIFSTYLSDVIFHPLAWLSC